MDITIVPDQDKNSITAYGKDGFKVKEKQYKKTIFLDSFKLVEFGIDSIKDLERINLSTLDSIINDSTEILLIGSGTNHIFVGDDFTTQIKQTYPLLSINQMSSSAACRTYNILIAEERIVAAILLPII